MLRSLHASWVQAEHKVHMHRICCPALFQYIACKCLCSKLLAHCAHTQHHHHNYSQHHHYHFVQTKTRWRKFILWSIFWKNISKIYPSSWERRIPSMLLPLWQHLSFFCPQISSISCYFYFATCRFALISSGIMFCSVDLRTFRVLFLLVHCRFSSRLHFWWRSYILEGTLWARVRSSWTSQFCITCEIQRWTVLVCLSICLWTTAGNIPVHSVAQDFRK